MTDDVPVSWFLIEPGWLVESPSGEEIGRVEEVTGDQNHDIFDGLSVATSRTGRPHYVPAEQVAEIVEGRVRLKLEPATVQALAEFREPPEQATVEPVDASALARVETAVAPPVEHPERVGLVRRLLLWLGLAGRR
jgi:hypothetical protein